MIYSSCNKITEEVDVKDIFFKISIARPKMIDKINGTSDETAFTHFNILLGAIVNRMWINQNVKNQNLRVGSNGLFKF